MLTFEDAFSAKLNLLPCKMLLFSYTDLYFKALLLEASYVEIAISTFQSFTPKTPCKSMKTKPQNL